MICKCTHEKSEHFDRQHNCMRDCECLAFRDEKTPSTLPPRPNHAAHCQCTRCKLHPTPALDTDDAAPTPRMWPPWPVWP